jgi:hypothetical protein
VFRRPEVARTAADAACKKNLRHLVFSSPVQQHRAIF